MQMCEFVNMQVHNHRALMKKRLLKACNVRINLNQRVYNFQFLKV